GIEESDEVLSKIRKVEFRVSGRFRNQNDALYQIKFIHFSRRENARIYILGRDSIAYRGYIYKSPDDSIDLEYMAALFE
ncbi:MAG: hypothetical protein FWD23_13740, partial [Oscillospiraceae bacterium]|nr:hypothetical protein [Oscillospiraceae bacterium]